MKTKIISIEVRGPVGSGKTAVVVSIQELLEKHGYFVAVMERDAKSARNIEKAASHELPARDTTLFCITERVDAFSSCGLEESRKP
jgi:Ni2+-binding GTPase involved in maturation of urease and hydrogenase